MSVTDTCKEILDDIVRRTNEMQADECVMTMLYIGEHCKAYAQTILAHEYHRALYPRDAKAGD